MDFWSSEKEPIEAFLKMFDKCMKDDELSAGLKKVNQLIWFDYTKDGPECSFWVDCRGGNLAALFALGQDAWNLLPWLELMHRDPTFHFPGQSGSYSDARLGTLYREPAWAVFRNGRPMAYEADGAAPGGE